ncbi:MAG: hypothetical protein HGB17_17990, partial [Syntrophobacteraceae bacterium]|nr:hypothetical protein [Syntrophobacteraceae bacterium]
MARFLSTDPIGGTPEVQQSWNRYSYVQNNPILFIDPTGKAVFPSGEELKKVGDAVVNQYDLLPVKNGVSLQTFCNKGVQGILNAGDDHTLDNMKAAEMKDFLAKPENATEVSFSNAVAYANEGATVIAAKTAGEGSGHVAVIAPLPMVDSGSFGQKVPMLFNVGKTNQVMPLSRAFRALHKPKTYILNADKQLVDDR